MVRAIFFSTTPSLLYTRCCAGTDCTNHFAGITARRTATARAISHDSTVVGRSCCARRSTCVCLRVLLPHPRPSRSDRPPTT